MKTSERIRRALDEVYNEGNSSTIAHEGKVYRVDDLLKLCSDKRAVKIPLHRVAWILKFDPPHKARVESANLRTPIIVLHDGSRYVTLDGLHRIARALAHRIYTLPAKVLSQAELDSVKTVSNSDDLQP